MSRTTPCSTCPWHRDSDPTGAPIPGFNIDMMRGLANTVGEGDAMRPMMACHWSPEGSSGPGEVCADAIPCIGYVHVEGYSNIVVRIAAIEGRIDLSGVWSDCESLDMWPSFGEMLAAYEASCEG